MSPFTDFLVLRGSMIGSWSRLRPISDAAQLWMEEHIPVAQRQVRTEIIMAESDVLSLIQNLVAEGYKVQQ